MAAIITEKRVGIVASLDPTYTIRYEYPFPVAHLAAFLKFQLLFLGPLIIPRTYLIHGRNNPFIELFLSGREGESEVTNLLSSGVAYVTGHGHELFRTVLGHLESTAREEHPMVFDLERRRAAAGVFDMVIPKDRIVTIDAAPNVATEFQKRFKEAYEQRQGIDAFAQLNEFAKRKFEWRRTRNLVPTDDWGRNEVVDYILERAGTEEGKAIGECAVVAHQGVFVSSKPAGLQAADGIQVVARVTYIPDCEEEKSKLSGEKSLPKILTLNPRHSKTFEIDYTQFKSAPWATVKQIYDDGEWQNGLTRFETALDANEHREAEEALIELLTRISQRFRLKRSGIVGKVSSFASSGATDIGVDVANGIFPYSWILSPVRKVLSAAPEVLKRQQQRREAHSLVSYLLSSESDNGEPKPGFVPNDYSRR